MTAIRRNPGACAASRLLLPLALGLGAIGCVKSPSAELKDRMETVQREREPERLIAHAKDFAVMGDYTRAEQYLNAARDSGADERRIILLLLEACVSDHRYRDAIQHGEGFLRAHPNDQRTRLVLAALEAAVGYETQAEEELERVLSAEPRNADAHYALAVLYRDGLGSPGRADEHFRVYLSLRPDGSHAEEARGSLLTVIE
jgi:thioredoxin-like negative regulator of GroEL